GKKLYKKVAVDTDTEIKIEPLRLKVAVDGNSNQFNYNGEEHVFPLKAVLDEDYYSNKGYSDADIATLVATFDKERDKNAGRYSWFSEEEIEQANGTTQWSYGVDPRLMGLGFASYVASESATDFYGGTTGGSIEGGSRVFKDAGTYWANQLHILRALGTGNSGNAFNTNYAWSANGAQTIAPESPEDTGTVSAEILPADGFDIYALYVQKTFGTILDPTPAANNTFTPGDGGAFDIEALKDSWDEASKGKFEETWILAIDGLFDVDYKKFGSLIAAKLKRDVTGMSQKAGLYDVYLDGFINQEFLALFNNYGIKLASADATTALENYGAVKMHWVNEDGSIKSGSYDFTTAVSAYSGERNNFEIVAKDISLEYTGATTYTYNGKPQ
ncbi:MAG: hypothetical protein K2N18_04655, partial [Clostridia bacterium]|nr:hypothetical protein [Clostridia bacterium]